MRAPDRSEVLEIIDLLLAGELSREDASRWAGALHVEESPDSLVEEALDLLTLVDAWQINEEGNRTGYLYDFDGLATIREILGATAGDDDA